MCGIFGTVSRNPIDKTPFFTLAQANLHRRDLAFGHLQVHEQKEQTAVAQCPFYSPYKINK